MAIRKILTHQDELLRKKSKPVEHIDARILTLIDDMTETMQKAPGAGIAAPQVGVLRRVIVIDVGDGTGLIQLINPELIAKEGEQEETEGCLSVPNRRGYVKRPQKVLVKGLTRNGKTINIAGDGLLAVALCHELDHLDGLLFTDKITREAPMEDA